MNKKSLPPLPIDPKSYKKGDQVLLDCGYWGVDDTKVCELMEDPQVLTPLFPDSTNNVVASVRILGSADIFTADLSLATRVVDTKDEADTSFTWRSGAPSSRRNARPRNISPTQTPAYGTTNIV